MAKRKAATPPEELPEEEISQEPPDEQSDPHDDFLTPEESVAREEHALSGEEMSKADMIRAAIEAGHDTGKPGCAFIKERFGVEVSPATFAATKSQINRREEGREPRPRAQHTAPTLQTGQAGIPQGFGGDVRSIKELIEEAGGAEQLRELTGKIGMLTQKYGVSGLNELISAFE